MNTPAIGALAASSLSVHAIESGKQGESSATKPARTNDRTGIRAAFKLAALFALVKLVLHISANLWQPHVGWGYFTDEFYYILCGQRLDWAYVDHGPLVALQARLAVGLFGRSLAGIRMFSALAGAVKLLLTGLLAWQLGARRGGQMVALAGVLLCPQFLAVDSFLSMNSFEPVFWMTAAMAILQLLKEESYLWWFIFGLAAGLGSENKPSMVFFLLALMLGLLVTRARRVLFSRGMLLGISVAVLLVLPNLFWQATHGWATFHFLHNATAARHSSLRLFIPAQIELMGFVSVPLLVAGLGWLLVDRNAAHFRFLGLTYLFFLIIMMALRSKDYYLTPIYPILFAAGGVAFETYASTRLRRWSLGIYVVPVLVLETLVLPLVLAMVTPDRWLVLAEMTHLRSRAAQQVEPFPDFYSLRFGWQELTDDVTQVYQSLPLSEQRQAGIFCATWNTASAINFLGRGLPYAISGRDNYFLWGPHGENGAVMIVVTTATSEELLQEYKVVKEVGSMHNPYAYPWHTKIYLCQDRRRSLADDWQKVKRYD